MLRKSRSTADVNVKYFWYALYAVAIVAAVLLLKTVVHWVKGFFNTTGNALGITNSKEKDLVNHDYDSGSSFLSSDTFLKWKKHEPDGTPLITVAEAKQLVKRLKSYMGYFFDDDSKAVALFAQLPTQYCVAWFAYQFQLETGKDLFYWMRKSDTLFAQGFSAGTVSHIINLVKAKPQF